MFKQLAVKGQLPVAALVRDTGLAAPMVKQALLILLQQNAITAYLQPGEETPRGPKPSVPVYEVQVDRVLQMLRWVRTERGVGVCGLTAQCSRCRQGGYEALVNRVRTRGKPWGPRGCRPDLRLLAALLRKGRGSLAELPQPVYSAVARVATSVTFPLPAAGTPASCCTLRTRRGTWRSTSWRCCCRRAGCGLAGGVRDSLWAVGLAGGTGMQVLHVRERVTVSWSHSRWPWEAAEDEAARAAARTMVWGRRILGVVGGGVGASAVRGRKRRRESMAVGWDSRERMHGSMAEWEARRR